MCTGFVGIDVENLEATAAEFGQVVPLGAILERVSLDCRPVVRRAYADWNDPAIAERQNEYRNYGFELLHAPSDRRGKNVADMMLALDAAETLGQTDCPDHFWIVSGDGDFVPLVSKLRRRSKAVSALGFRSNTSFTFSRVVDQFVCFEDLLADHGRARAPMAAVGPPAASETASAEPAVSVMGSVVALESAAVALAEPAVAVGGIILPGDTYPLRFDTPAESAKSLRRIMERRKKVRVLHYSDRRALLEALFELFAQSSRQFISVGEVTDELNRYNEGHVLGLYPRDIDKLLYTMSIARLFDCSEERWNGFHEELGIRPHYAIEDTELLIHRIYIHGITQEAPTAPLEADAVALFLYDELNDATKRLAENTLSEFGANKITSSVGDAMRRAVERKQRK